jgi:hypothetical protein
MKKTDKTMQNEKRQTYKQDWPGKEYKDWVTRTHVKTTTSVV